MAIIVAVFLYALLRVDDVSAQTSCVIFPLNITALTINNGLGTLVEFNCQCMDDNGTMITEPRWFHIGILVIVGDGSQNGPYYETGAPGTLLIRSFDSTHTGTYTCSPSSTSHTVSGVDTITLSAGSNSGTIICNIVSTSLTTVDVNGGEIINGTQNVIIYCTCSGNGVATGGTAISWFLNGDQITLTQSDGTDSPYSRNVVPSQLVIPSFVNPYNGRYSCGPSTTFSDELSSITLTLVASFEPPTNVSATVLTPHSVEVTWDQSSSDDVTGYLISYTTTASYTSGGRVTVNGHSNTSHTLTNLEEDTPYIITVRATDSNNLMSINSNPVLVTTYTAAPSSPPHNVTVTDADPASLMVTWEPPLEINQNGPITGYEIQYTRDGSSATVMTNGTTHTIPGLVAYVEYSVRVAAVNVNGTGPYSDPVVGRSGEDTPSEPRLLEVVAVNSSSVTLQWMPPEILNGTITHYSIQVNNTNAIPIDTIGNDMMNILMGTVGGLSHDTVYVLQLRAHTRVGAGPPTNVTVMTSVGPVSGVTVRDEDVKSSEVTLTWMEITLTNSVFSHYTVFYLPVSGPYGPIMTSNRRKRQSAQDGEFIMNFTRATSTGTLTNLYGAVTYRIQVAVVATLYGEQVTGDRSDAINITTEEGLPTAPQDLSIDLNNNDGTFNVTLTWRRPDPPNGLITQYNVSYVSNSQDSNVITQEADNSIGSSYTWTDLIQGRYQFSVIAFTSKGPGEAASLMLFTLPRTRSEANSGDSSDDNNEVIIALAIISAIAIIGLVISVVITIFLAMKLKQSRHDVKQSSVRFSKVKQSALRDNTTSDHSPSEAEYEVITDPKLAAAGSVNVKMNANPAYQATS